MLAAVLSSGRKRQVTLHVADTWTVPAGITRVKVLFAARGGTIAYTGQTQVGGAGGGGWINNVNMLVSPGDVLSFVSIGSFGVSQEGFALRNSAYSGVNLLTVISGDSRPDCLAATGGDASSYDPLTTTTQTAQGGGAGASINGQVVTITGSFFGGGTLNGGGKGGAAGDSTIPTNGGTGGSSGTQAGVPNNTWRGGGGGGFYVGATLLSGTNTTPPALSNPPTMALLSY